VLDVFGVMPFMAAAMISHDPPGPLAGHSSGGFLAGLSDEAIDTLLAYSLPQPGAHPPLVKAEVHLMGGAIARTPDGAMAVSHRDQALLLSLIAVTPTDEAHQAAVAHSAAALRALGPHLSGAAYPNFLDGEGQIVRINDFFSPGKAERLQAAKAAYDPDNCLRYG
jgi:hypothetical protein